MGTAGQAVTAAGGEKGIRIPATVLLMAQVSALYSLTQPFSSSVL